MPLRVGALLVLAALVLSACTGTSSTPPSESPAPTAASVTGGPREDVPSALTDLGNPELPAPLVDTDRIISGGPPPDGIPPIDAPRFVPVEEVDWVGDDEAVIALDLGDEHRAYPVQILMWHEIVNDVVGERPVAVTYCPLCNSALAFDRQVGDRLLTFGTSGRLYLSALVMYDRQTESLWSQVERTAIAGVLTGTELDLIPVTTVRWADWRAAHPEGRVLSRETGFSRDYGRNPYVGYDAVGNEDTFLDAAVDGRFPAKERVVTFPGAVQPVAVLAADLASVGVADVEVDGATVVLFSSPGLASALRSPNVGDGDAVLATGAFRAVANGRVLAFSAAPTGEEASSAGAVAVDAETGSGWDIFGKAVSGPLAGASLERVPHLDTFWFAQAAFEPETVVLSLTAS
ncbi:MAG: DUF3179 domain-containing protein [Dermatophilaceae bacterium]|nr:DUF3179 domain-containing protein [Intrasporangiaceae bacterium]